MMVLGNYMLRSMRQRPGRTLLTLASIVIGVAGVVGVSISSATSRAALNTMFATVTGNAGLEITADTGGSFSETVLEQIRAQNISGIVVAAPMLRRQAMLALEETQVATMALGVDPAVDGKVRDFVLKEGEELKDGEEGVVHIEEGSARDLGLGLDSEIGLIGGRGSYHALRVTGVLKAKSGSGLRQQGFVFLPLKFAQDLFESQGEIDAVQLVLAPSANVDEVKKQVEVALDTLKLPKKLKVGRPGFDAQSMQETLLSFELATTMSSGFTLLLAAFIILNTFFMNVGERRKQLAIMRAIGATRNQIFGALLLEAVLLGVVGSALGLVAGIALARGLVIAQSQVLQFSIPDWELQPIVLVWSLGFGLLISVVGALVPAWRAGQLTPLEGMRGVIQQDLDRLSTRYMVLGFLLVILNFALILATFKGWLPSRVNDFAGTGLLLGLVLSVPPLILAPFATLLGGLLRPMFRVEADLALRQVLRHRTRSALTTGVLFIAGATGIGMAISILDTVTNVRNWYAVAIQGDFFIRVAMPGMVTPGAPKLSKDLLAEMEKLKADGEITDFDPIRFSPVNSGDRQLTVITRNFDKQERKLPFEVVSGDKEHLWQAMQNGEVAIGSVLARRWELKVGDYLELNTPSQDGGRSKFKVAAVVNDYFGGGLTTYMPRHLAEQKLDISGTDGYALFVPEKNREALKPKLQDLCKRRRLLLMSYADIKGTIDSMVNTMDGCLWVLLLLGFVVSAFGVVNTLTMNVLEQTRELGMLRIVAMTRSQVRKTILMQALIIGVIGVLPGVLAGVGTGLLINFGMAPELGREVEFHTHPEFVFAVWVGAMAIVLVSALVPAERAARLDVVEALHYE